MVLGAYVLILISPQGVFWCGKPPSEGGVWGKVRLSVPSSHVNDGVCDCCDGSDEWKRKIVCTNTCHK